METVADNRNDKIVLKERYKKISFSVYYESEKGGVIEKFNIGKQTKQERKKNIETLKILANEGMKYRLLPIIEDGNKNPDAFNLITMTYVDIKVAESSNGKNIIQSAMKEAHKQKVEELILRFIKKPISYRNVYYAIRERILQGFYRRIKTLVVIFPDNQVKVYKIKRIQDFIKKDTSKLINKY